MPLPLEGIRVLDLSRILSGPYCTMTLGDFGADVIKLELPGRGDDSRQWGPPFCQGESTYYLSVNRNKRGITVNLKHPDGVQVFRDLLGKSDVLIENFSPGTMEKLGLGYEQLAALNPRLIYCSITGFGPDGPYRNLPGFDVIMQGIGGLMSFTGEPEGEPMKVGVAIVDITAGMFAALGILLALQVRNRTGKGQRVDTSLLETQVAWLANVAGGYLNTGKLPQRHGNAHPNLSPYETFKTSDGHLIVGVGNDSQFERFCRVLGRPELSADPRFRTNPARVENRRTLIPLLGEILAHDSTRNWIEALQQNDIPCGPINNLEQVFSDPQVLARQMLQSINHPTIGSLKQTGIPIKMNSTPGSIRRHPPLLGEHTDQVLSELLGYSPERIRELHSRGAL